MRHAGRFHVYRSAEFHQNRLRRTRLRNSTDQALKSISLREGLHSLDGRRVMLDRIGMKQMSLSGKATGLERKTKRTRKPAFSDEMNWVVPWAELVALIAPFAPTRSAKGGRPHSLWRPGCAFSSCISGSTCRILPWKRRCTTPRCCASLRVWRPGKRTCPTRAPSFAFATCSKRTT